MLTRRRGGWLEAIADVRGALGSMHVDYDTWSSEQALVDSGAMAASLKELEARATSLWPKEPPGFARPTSATTRIEVLIKADGEPTYLLPILPIIVTNSRGELVIDILGADHHEKLARMRAALLALGYDADAYEAIIGQSSEKLVANGEGGQALEAHRHDDRDCGRYCGSGPTLRFAYLLQSIDTTQTLDLDILKAQAADNPVFYVQYANARIHSITRKASEAGVERLPLTDVDLSLLVDESELGLLRKLSEFPEQLALACSDRAPQKVTTWVRELASDFHTFYGRCKILHSEVSPELAQARLWLVETVRIGLATGLDLLGVSAPEQM
ncbi:MAG: DALR anticodon-binding domain-containing protein [Acidimicrobiales bacterium]